MKTLLIPVLTLFLVGCVSDGVSTIPEAVRIGVYAETDAIHAGRFDLAEKYGDELERIVPAPKVRLAFTPVLRPVADPEAPVTPPRAVLAGILPIPISPAPAPIKYERVNISPLDTAPLTLSVSAPTVANLLNTPVATTEASQAMAYVKTVDTQQITVAHAAAVDHATVQTDKVKLAAASKWKWALITLGVGVGLAILAYLAWQLKWFGL